MLSNWNPLGPDTWRLMFVVGALPALFVLYIRRNVGESEKWLAAVREQRWNAVEGAHAPGGKCKPFGLAEPKRWIRREKGCDVSVVVVGQPGRRPTEER
jgi:hypothetical protein